jgi:hypothetical protein
MAGSSRHRRDVASLAVIAPDRPVRSKLRFNDGLLPLGPYGQPSRPVSVLVDAGLAELALWRGDPDQAKQLAAQAVPLVAANPRYAAPVCALGLRVEADRAELALAWSRPPRPTRRRPPSSWA